MGDSFVEMSFSQLNNMADRGNTVRRCGFVRRTTFASEKKSVPNPINDAKLLGLQLGSLDEEDEEEKELDDQTMMEFETGFVVNFNENLSPDSESIPAFLKINGENQDGGFRVVPAED